MKAIGWYIQIYVNFIKESCCTIEYGIHRCLELCGAVLGKRLACFIEEESRYNIKKKYFIVDSQVVQSMIRKESYGFRTFAGVRIGEIQKATNVDDWYWVEGNLNVANFITRGKMPSQLSIDSTWQQGPDFLKNTVEEWPICGSVCNGILPEESKMVNIWLVNAINEVADKINVNKYSKFKKLIEVTARIYSLFSKMYPGFKPSFRNILVFPSPDDIAKAEQFWVKDAQQSMIEGIKKGDFKR